TNFRDRVVHGRAKEYGSQIPEPFEEIGSNYYYIDHTHTSNWFGAVERCRQVGGNLINLQSKLELAQVASKLNSSLDYWTDLNNLVAVQTFYSLTTGVPSAFFNGLMKVSKSDYNQCGVLRYDQSAKEFVLSRQDCLHKHAYPICQTAQPTTISFLFW
ncbi:hypothetical protein KR222_004098, partial [Zaprionus bogoriensis]